MAQGPGWYQDPGGSSQQRFWDGEHWTAALRDVPLPADPPSQAPRRRSRRALVTFAGALVLARIGVFVGLNFAGSGSSETAEPELSDTAPNDTSADSEGDLGQATTGQPDAVLADSPIIDLVARIERPADRQGMVSFIDIDGLRDAGALAAPDPAGDGWSAAVDAVSIMVFADPYYSFASLRRAVPMEHVLGLSFDEIGGSARTFSDSPPC